MNLIVAVDKNYGIGKDGKLLCSLPSDLKYFKEKTIGKVVVMGRSTLESLPKKMPLPNRTNIVLTSKKDYVVPNATVVHDMESLMEEMNKYKSNDIFIIGGASVYNELLPICDSLFITKIDNEFDADCFITNVDKLPNFKMVWSSKVLEENGIKFQFTEYKRKRV